MKRSTAYIKLIQLFLWTLAFFSLVLLLGHNYLSSNTFDIVNTTVAGVEFGMGLRLDILSALLFFMISLLSASIGHYSLRYLDGEVRQPYFFRHLLGIALSASLLVLSSNLIMFFAMWLATSYNLHKLLIYYHERPQAVLAARKKVLVSRLGDLALLAAFALIYKTFGTFEFSELFAAAASMIGEQSQAPMSAIGILITIGALCKSAQFPFHFWLPDTMETPTPVSALMHAGVINAGGFLIIRMSPLLQHDVAAHYILAVAGTISAVFGALCMIVQNDIKKKLAYSTISQMGMMMFACGIGAYSIALFHIFAHSFYKAYAFLSTGKLVDESKKIGLKLTAPTMGTIVLAGATGFTAIALASTYFQGAYLPVATYCAILTLGLFQNTSTSEIPSLIKPGVFVKIILTLIFAIVGYSFIEYTLNQTLTDSFAQKITSPVELNAMIVLALLTFTLCLSSLYFSTRLMQIDTPFLEKAYIYLRNGGYLGIRTSVLLSSIYPYKKSLT